jgi:glycosyltransferase involved in cell wall biosynthesis
MIESMACGTPVIAYSCGSVPEVVDEGKTGFVVNSLKEAVDAVKKLSGLDRKGCREIFEKRFSVQRMADDYLMIYESMISESDNKKVAHVVKNTLST